MRQLFSVLLLSTWLLPVPLRAAEQPPGNNLETVVVSATRTEQRRDVTGTSISVINSGDLSTEHINVVTDALRETPGLTVVQNGGPGQFASIGLRGAAAGQTLVLIDGVRINDPSAPDTEVLAGDLFVNNIDRIEILRGPQSTLYGSDAIGGVINIFTRRGGQAPFSGAATAEGGTFGTFRLNASAYGTAAGIEYGGGINLYSTEGIAAADTRPVRVNPDPARNFGATANLRVPVTTQVSVDARVWYVDTHVVFDGFPPPDFTLQYTGEYSTDQLLALYGGVNVALLAGRFHNRFAMTALDSERRFFNPSLAVPNEFYGKGGSANFEYQGVLDLTPTDQLTIGAESLRTRLSTASPSPIDPTPPPVAGHSRINSYYGQYQTTWFDQLTLTGGIRHDDDAEFGSHNSLKGAIAWQMFGGDTNLRANYGDGFKAPSLYELFSPFSNPIQKLAPETAHGWEAGADQKLLGGRATISVVWFERNTKDQIDFFSCFEVSSAACSQRPFGYYANILKSRAEGVEIEGSAEIFETIHLYGNLTDMTAIDLVTHNDLARRPRIMANARIVWTPDSAWSIGASATYSGKRFDDTFEAVRLTPFTVVNLFASYAVNNRLQIFGRAENLFDQRYETAAGYRSLPRSLTAGLRLTL